ncbi:MAG: hypothetical protein M0Z67_04360 [Nitrospiraceae bacterium]|nr:hypothetical protein [Nitrospiraceae bacterium]
MHVPIEITGRWVMAHEMSHIAAGLKFDEWGHGRNHKRIYQFCRGKEGRK